MSKTECVFCKIISGEISAKIVNKDKDVVVFYDVNPKAKTHLLIVSRVHVKSFLDIKDKQLPLLTNMIKMVQTKKNLNKKFVLSIYTKPSLIMR